MSITIRRNEKGERVGLVHKIDDQGFDPPQRNYERRSKATIGHYAKFLAIISEYGPLCGDELSLIFNRKKHAVYTCARYLELKGLLRKVGEHRERAGKPVPIFDVVRTGEQSGVFAAGANERQVRSVP